MCEKRTSIEEYVTSLDNDAHITCPTLLFRLEWLKSLLSVGNTRFSVVGCVVSSVEYLQEVSRLKPHPENNICGCKHTYCFPWSFT